MRLRCERRCRLLATAGVCAVLIFAASLSARAQTMAPVADPGAVVVSGQARFTVLTPRLVRMEWSGASQFEDRASLVFINRKQPVPPFTTATKAGWLTVTTSALTLRYKTGSGAFTGSNLEIRFTLNGTPVVWHPGLADQGNLLGTTRTLDGVNGPATKLEPGLISRDGWVVVDDTARLLYDGSDWPWVTPRPPLDIARGGPERVEGPAGTRQDLYFFGYGHDYRGALADFTKVAGRIPMPPRFAFGIWWSRYWAYTDEEFMQLVRDFESRTLPLDVLVVDMDWHQTFGGAWDNNPKDQSGHTKGWTGFTWDRNYFPDPAGFLKWTDVHGLRTPLNLHPASGIQPWEDQYPAMARAMGIDPATERYVPFDIVNKKFAVNFFDLVIHPLEKQGVDFWWLDWQQSDKTSLEGINPTWWLNYTFFTDMERQGRHRPLIFHRWGGLGNHRYQVGFSGDTYSTWQSLAYQPYFTATAANVGFGYWSHDIGGHMDGPVEPELYTRWIQFGAFSPILRTHTTKNPGAERRIWAYPVEYSDAMREAFLLRSSLIPYIYTASRQTYDTGVPFLRPLYWDSPEAPEAYAVKDEYLFGDSMLVAPVVGPRRRETGFATRSVWLPAGTWVEWYSGRVLVGPTTIERNFALDEIPVYVKSGAIIAMQHPVERAGAHPMADPLVLEIFPSPKNTGSVHDERGDSTGRAPGDAVPLTTRVYEDQGDSTAYEAGEGAWTAVGASARRDVRIVRIEPLEGRYPGMPAARGYEIRLRDTPAPQTATVNGRVATFATAAERAERSKAGAPARAVWWYDGDTATVVVSVPPTPTSSSIEIRVELGATRAASAGRTGEPGAADEIAAGFAGTMRRLHDLHALVNGSWPKVAPPDLLLNLVQAGNRMSIDPARASLEFELVRRKLPELRVAIDKLTLTPEARTKADAIFREMGY
jgi:Glycosyl hydrolases family 31 TIM-barrel domain/Glycosyl hydrolase family 31 C-terminal domain/Domain of unknown function (DUF5110)